MEKRHFFRAATAGLGKYRTGGYGWVVVSKRVTLVRYGSYIYLM